MALNLEMISVTRNVVSLCSLKKLSNDINRCRKLELTLEIPIMEQNETMKTNGFEK